MIGFYVGEDSIHFEFRPVAASSAMRWAHFKIPFITPRPKHWGEWGFAFGRSSIWIYRGNEQYFKAYWWKR